MIKRLVNILIMAWATLATLVAGGIAVPLTFFAVVGSTVKRQRNTFRRRRRPTDGGTALLQQKAFNLRARIEAIQENSKERARTASTGPVNVRDTDATGGKQLSVFVADFKSATRSSC